MDGTAANDHTYQVAPEDFLDHDGGLLFSSPRIRLWPHLPPQRLRRRSGRTEFTRRPRAGVRSALPMLGEAPPRLLPIRLVAPIVGSDMVGLESSVLCLAARQQMLKPSNDALHAAATLCAGTRECEEQIGQRKRNAASVKSHKKGRSTGEFIAQTEGRSKKKQLTGVANALWVKEKQATPRRENFSK